MLIEIHRRISHGSKTSSRFFRETREDKRLNFFSFLGMDSKIRVGFVEGDGVIYRDGGAPVRSRLVGVGGDHGPESDRPVQGGRRVR